MSEERDDLKRDEEQPSTEPEPTEPAVEADTEVDAAKLSDEAAAEAARAFLGTAEPEEEGSVDEVKSVLRRAGAVAEAETGEVAPVGAPVAGGRAVEGPPLCRAGRPAVRSDRRRSRHRPPLVRDPHLFGL